MLALLAALGMALLAVSSMHAASEAPTGRVQLQQQALRQGPSNDLERSLATLSRDWRSAEYSEREVKKEEELSAPSGDQLWWGQKRHGKWKKHKRRGEYDENQDLLAHHRYTPPYNPIKENEGVPEREREEAVWGPWAQGDTTYWGAPRGIGYASARRGQAALKGYY